MKSVHIRSFFSSVFSFIPTKYGDLQSKSPYSVRRQENTDQKKLLIRTLFTQRVTPQNKGSTKKDFSHLYFPAWVKVTSNNPHWKFKRLWNETFMGFLRQSARQELYGFSLRVNHLWFKLEKNPFCVLLFYIIGGSRYLLINLYRNLSGSYTTWRNYINISYILAIKVVRFWSKNTTLEWQPWGCFFLSKQILNSDSSVV